MNKSERKKKKDELMKEFGELILLDVRENVENFLLQHKDKFVLHNITLPSYVAIKAENKWDARNEWLDIESVKFYDENRNIIVIPDNLVEQGTLNFNKLIVNVIMDLEDDLSHLEFALSDDDANPKLIEFKFI